MAVAFSARNTDMASLLSAQTMVQAYPVLHMAF